MLCHECITGVLQVELNRPKALNAMNNQFWIDCEQCFRWVDADPEVHQRLQNPSLQNSTVQRLQMREKTPIS